jgi:hypothetical protein
MAGIGGNDPTGTLVSVQRQDIAVLFVHPKILIEAFL